MQLTLVPLGTQVRVPLHVVIRTSCWLAEVDVLLPVWWRRVPFRPSCCVTFHGALKALVHRRRRLLRASRTTVGYCVRPARRSATACSARRSATACVRTTVGYCVLRTTVGYCVRPHDGRLLRASRTTVGYCVLRTTVGYCVLRTTVGYCVLRTTVGYCVRPARTRGSTCGHSRFSLRCWGLRSPGVQSVQPERSCSNSARSSAPTRGGGGGRVAAVRSSSAMVGSASSSAPVHSRLS